jgi:hypothetical protein
MEGGRKEGEGSSKRRGKAGIETRDQTKEGWKRGREGCRKARERKGKGRKEGRQAGAGYGRKKEDGREKGEKDRTERGRKKEGKGSNVVVRLDRRKRVHIVLGKRASQKAGG